MAILIENVYIAEICLFFTICKQTVELATTNSWFKDYIKLDQERLVLHRNEKLIKNVISLLRTSTFSFDCQCFVKIPIG